jgi:hypothetical protein
MAASAGQFDQLLTLGFQTISSVPIFIIVSFLYIVLFCFPPHIYCGRTILYFLEFFWNNCLRAVFRAYGHRLLPHNLPNEIQLKHRENKVY